MRYAAVPVADPTILQFGRESPRSAEVGAATTPSGGRVCPECGHRFTGDARFCPFDGANLGARSSVDPAGDPLVGTVVDGRYRVDRVIGEGGMGTVYEARHTSLGRPFALKALKKVLAQDGELSARFIQEARAAASVAHPSVVQITDFGVLSEGQPYFVMEMLEGESLSSLIAKGGPLPAGQAVRILRQVVEALAAAHAAGVVHRDLKPDNVHVGSAAGSGSEVVKVLDFGLAKVAGASKLTRAGMVFGTPHYMSPEQASGDPVDHRSDVYSLGIVMYEMFTGRVPFEADSYMGVLTKHMYMVPTPPSEVVESAKELGALEDITLRCLQKKPEARFSSMTELLNELDAVVSLRDGEAVVRPSRVSTASPRRNVLADELELPTSDEMRVALRRAGVGPAASPAAVTVAILGGVLFAGALVALAVAKGGGQEPAPPDTSAAAVAADGAKGAPVAVTASPMAAPAALPVSVPAEPVPVSPKASEPRPTKPVRKAIAPPAPRPKAPTAPNIRGSEIVNPWAD